MGALVWLGPLLMAPGASVGGTGVSGSGLGGSSEQRLVLV